MEGPNYLTAGPISARMAGDERRMQIVRVAVTLFSQRGFSGTTTREIAHAAGISEAMVFRHFATKEELYSAILDYKACSGGPFDPREIVADAVERKDDRAVFEQLAFHILEHHECDTEFHPLLLHAALEGHELAAMFWERNVRPAYEFLGGYISSRQREGAMVEVDPLVVVRVFIGMVIHHSLNNTLWDRKRSLLNISNEEAARQFTNVLLHGIIKKAGAESMGNNGSKPANGAAPENRSKK